MSETLRETDTDPNPDVPDHRRRWKPRGRHWLAAVLAALAITGYLSRQVYLFWDDFLFLDQARSEPFGTRYLRMDLFGHFSPVSRIGDKALVWLVPSHPGIAQWLLVVLDAAFVVGVLALAITLFGRSALALGVLLVVCTSLSVLPLTNWWTAGLNILPAVAGSAACFAAVVTYLRGRSIWWAVAGIVALVIALADYELAMLTPIYLFLWLLLFHQRLRPEGLRAILRRSWWLWFVLGALVVGSILNYKIFYYQPTPRADLPDLVHGLYNSLFRALLPSLLGLHGAPGSALSYAGEAMAWVGLALLVLWTLRRNRDAWRGWLFAGLGWLAPASALVISRAGLYGPGVGDDLVYTLVPLLFFVIGAAEAVRIALTSPPPPAGARHHGVRLGRGRTALRSGILLAVLAAYATGYGYSTGPTLVNQMSSAPARPYLTNLQTGIHALEKQGGFFSIINSDVPAFLVPAQFAPYNRMGRVLAVLRPEVAVDSVRGDLYALDGTGKPRRVTFQPLADFDLGSGETSAVRIDGTVRNLRTDPARGVCFTAVDGTSRLVLQLAAPASGSDLALRTGFEVTSPTTATVWVAPAPDRALVAANYDAHIWAPDNHGVYDTVASTAVSAIVIGSFTPDTSVCVGRIEVGTVGVAR